MSVSLLVGLLPYWYYTNIAISPLLKEISFWNFLETFLRCWYTNSKWFWNFCMSLSLLFGLLAYWNYTNVDNSSSGWDIFLKFLGDILGTLIQYFQIILNFFYVCRSVRWLFPYWNITNMGLSWLLDEIYFWKFLETLLGCLHTNSK